MRDISTDAATQIERTEGAFPVRVLELRWASGTVYYTGGNAAMPATVAAHESARVLSWGQLQFGGEVDKVATTGTVSLTLADHDLAVKSLADVEPGLTGTVAIIHLWMSGTAWADRITLFEGRVAKGSQWNLRDATWTLKIDGFEKRATGKLGVAITRDAFPEVACRTSEGQIVPIAFGDTVRRIPCPLLDYPGNSFLRSRLRVNDSVFFVVRDASTDGFTIDTEITVYVGVPGNYEWFTGSFDTASGLTQFNITSRGYFGDSGDTAGTYSDSGKSYLLVNSADLAYPTISRQGYVIYLYLSGVWRAWVIDNWFATGAQTAVLNITGMSVPAGTPWRMSNMPSGHVPDWPAGTPVYEDGDYVYGVNSLPSKDVTLLEVKGRVGPDNGGVPTDAWFTVNEAYWSANLDNRTWNESIGRTSGQPGITTITVAMPPQQMGMSGLDDTLFATVRGIMDNDNPSTGTPITNPVRAAQKLLESPYLGNVGAAHVNQDAFDSAAAVADTFIGGSPLSVAFAITGDDRKLWDLVSDLLFQAGCLSFVDQGQVFAREMKQAPAVGDTVLSLTADAIQRGELKIEDPGDTERVTELLAKFKLTCGDSRERKIKRVTTTQSEFYGPQRKEINFWAYQSPEMVAELAGWWLKALAQQQRQVVFKTFLQAAAIQPGDTVDITLTDVFGDSVPAFVTKVNHTPLDLSKDQIETIELTAKMNLWDVEVVAATVEDEVCLDGSGGGYPNDPPIDVEQPPPDDRTTTSSTSSTSSTSTTSTTTSPPGTTSSTTAPPGCPCYVVNVGNIRQLLGGTDYTDCTIYLRRPSSFDYCDEFLLFGGYSKLGSTVINMPFPVVLGGSTARLYGVGGSYGYLEVVVWAQTHTSTAMYRSNSLIPAAAGLPYDLRGTYTMVSGAGDLFQLPSTVSVDYIACGDATTTTTSTTAAPTTTTTTTTTAAPTTTTTTTTSSTSSTTGAGGYCTSCSGSNQTYTMVGSFATENCANCVSFNNQTLTWVSDCRWESPTITLPCGATLGDCKWVYTRTGGNQKLELVTTAAGVQVQYSASGCSGPYLGLDFVDDFGMCNWSSTVNIF